MKTFRKIICDLVENKIATVQQLKKNKKLRISYALSAIERDSLSDDSETAKKADQVFDNFKKLSNDEVMRWATREQEYLGLR